MCDMADANMGIMGSADWEGKLSRDFCAIDKSKLVVNFPAQRFSLLGSFSSLANFLV